MAPNTRPELPELDFLVALELKERSVAVILGGQARTIRRAPLGLHYRLQAVEDALAYVSLASGLSEDDLLVEELAPAFTAIARLNSRAGHSILEVLASPERPKPAFDYRGRGLASVVHDLAHAYGWTADYILNELSPEEAWCYLQEVHLEEHHRRLFSYNLSDLGRDKRGRQKPMSDPAWMRLRVRQDERPDRPPLRADLAAKFEPTGTITNLDDLAPRRES